MVSVAPWKVVAAFSAFQLLVVGGMGTWAAARYRFPYYVLFPLTILAYTAAGHYAALAGASGTAAGALVALVEFAAYGLVRGFSMHVGWLELSWLERVLTLGVATLTGAACGLVGGWLTQ